VSGPRAIAICLRRHRCAPQAVPGGGRHRGREGAAEQDTAVV